MDTNVKIVIECGDWPDYNECGTIEARCTKHPHEVMQPLKYLFTILSYDSTDITGRPLKWPEFNKMTVVGGPRGGVMVMAGYPTGTWRMD